MAQVYQFVDANGETRLFAEITPDPAGTPFNGGTITAPLRIDTAVDPSLDVDGVSYMQVGTGIRSGANLGWTIVSHDESKVLISLDDSGFLGFGIVLGTAGFEIDPDGLIELRTGAATSVITSGALPTHTFSSGTAGQLSATRDVNSVTPFTGDGTNNAATLKIELSPDNSTFSTLDTLSIAAALNLTGALNIPVSLAVPAAFYVKLTAAHGTIGATTYY